MTAGTVTVVGRSPAPLPSYDVDSLPTNCLAANLLLFSCVPDQDP
jgi:hypothetical protein